MYYSFFDRDLKMEKKKTSKVGQILSMHCVLICDFPSNGL